MNKDIYNIIYWSVLFTLIIVMIFLSWKQYIKSKETTSILISDGFKHIFKGKGNNYIAFNMNRALFRAGNLTKNNYFQAPIYLIHNYEWKWKETNAKKSENTFFIYISDINFPVHKIYYRNNEYLSEADWARLRAVFHQPNEAQNIMNDEREQSQYDFFISHASEDKDTFVRPLVKQLNEFGINVWFDEQTLEIGDSLRRKIDNGLKKANYGVVVLSHSFFDKKWTQYELDALVTRSMNSEEKVILPIWHNINASDVATYSLYLADKLALQTSNQSIPEIAKQLSEIALRLRK
ncbi:toll/interleukin-1 receptor domain-containing protein [Raoultella planticola]|uniref:toll/interleukin-1 receptor domain-containing protein n=1 Tax=Raoultella planticola TaxID=575 RepID=UPI00177C104E|nr:toll/interleukin-1 receptor domain-containing protein [Raoultella planticola]MBE0090491.1 toll/interleukin-1 receptor domain-containing protein [Raoultella planticola]